jgi:nucleotide-binding universal stress UspA family protein
VFQRVLVGVDPDQAGRDPIALAKQLLGSDSRLTLAHVSTNDPRIYRAASTAPAGAERRSALELLAAARRGAAVEAELRFLPSTSVGRGLHELADQEGADLLVVGSARRSLLGRVLTGDDTRAALNTAPCAVAIAPAGYADGPSSIREVGVGYNETPESDHALALARTIAAEHGARLSAFEAISLPHYLFSGGPSPADESIDDFVADARRRIAALGGVEPHATYGHPAEELALYSASVDLLVVGSRGYGPLGRLVHGSTSELLARTARCPLLVLTRAARAAEMPRAGAT